MITEMVFEKGGDPCPTVEWQREMSKDECYRGIEKVVSFCASMGVEVEFGYNKTCTHMISKKIIAMNTRLSPCKMFYVLLHEAGHAVLHETMTADSDHTEFMLNYPGNVNKDNKAYVAEGDREHRLSRKDRRRYMITLIHEELDAWRKGIDIAAMLELPLNLYDYYSQATEGVESYVAGACQQGNLRIS